VDATGDEHPVPPPLTKFPNHKSARDGLKVLAGWAVKKVSKAQDAQEVELRSLMNLYNKGQLALVVEHAQVLTEQYPEAIAAWNLMGGISSSNWTVRPSSFCL
jgi:hypothetical protein